MQARQTFVLLLLAVWSLVGRAQEAADTTDMFLGHVDLGEVTVTGVTGQTRVRETPIPLTLVTSAALRQSSAPNIVGTLAHQPGLSAITTGSGIAKPIIRGLGYNRIICLADGIRQEGQQWGDEHGLEIDGAAVSSAEVIKGPASLMYGADALAGVIIFRAAPPRPEGSVGGGVTTEYQTNSGLLDYSLNFAGNLRGYFWDARWSQKFAHAYKNKLDGYVPSSQFRERAARALLGRSGEWGTSQLTLSAYRLTPGIIEGERDELTGELEAEDGWRGTSYARTLPFQEVKHRKAVSHTQLNLPAGTLDATLGYQQNQRQEFEESADDYELFFLQHTATYDLRYLTEERAGWKFTGGAGGMWQRSLNRGEEYLIPAYSLFDLGLYLTGSRRLGDVHLSGGLRYDRRWLHSHALEDEGELRFADFHRHFDGLTGSLGLTWNPRRGVTLRANVARGFRAPNLAELGSKGVHEGTARFEVGDSRLQAERSWQADLGMDYVDRFLSAQVALFASDIAHFIYLRRTSAAAVSAASTLPVYAYTSGTARLAGFELGVDFHPIHSLHFQNTFSYVLARLLHQDAAAKYLPMTPPARWTSEVKWEILHRPARLSRRLSLRNAFAAVNIECNLRQNHFLAADDTETATPSYTLLGLSLGTDVYLGGRKLFDLFLAADNLTDRAYQPHLSRLKYMALNPLTSRRGVCNPGRNLTLKVNIPF